MPLDGEPGTAAPNRDARVARALITAARNGEPPNPYVVLRLAEHVAAAGAWEELASAPYLLDQLDPDSVAVALLRTAFGRADLPAPLGASLSARHLFSRLAPQDRLMTRWIAVACGSWAQESDTHAWARIGEREPPHVAMFGHRGPVRAIAPWNQAGGGTLLVTSGDDGSVRVWDPKTGRPANAPLNVGGPRLLSMAVMTVHGRALLAAGGPRGVLIWNLDDGSRVDPEAEDSDRPVRMLAALPQTDGEVMLASVDDGGTVRLWRVHHDGLTPTEWAEPQHRTQALAAFPRADGRTWLVTVGYDSYIRFWDPVTSRETASYPTGRDPGQLTNAVTSDGDGLMLAVSEDDGSVELLDLDAYSRFRPFGALRVPSGAAVLATALAHPTADSVLIAAACEDGAVHLFSGISGQQVGDSVLIGHRGKVFASVFIALGEGRALLVTGGEDGTVRLWHVDPGELPPGGVGEPARIGAIAAIPTEADDQLAVGRDDGSVQLHMMASGMPAGEELTGHRGAVHAVGSARLPDGRAVLVTGGAERTVRVWDAATGGRLAGPLRGHQGTIHAVAVLRSGPSEWLLASAGSDGAIYLWDPVSGRPIGSPLRGHEGPIWCLAVVGTPAGSDSLISGSEDGTLRLWQLNRSGAVELMRADVPGTVKAAVVVSDEPAAQVVAAGGSDGVVRLLDTATWRVVYSLQDGTPAEITALAAVPAAATMLAAGHGDGVIRLWHPDSGRLLRTVLLPSGQRPNGLAATSSHLAACTERGFLGFELDPRLGRELFASRYRYRQGSGTTLPA
jgi:WD40 repeat protein